MPIRNEIGKRIRQARSALGLSQTDLAKKLGQIDKSKGWRAGTISMWESGERSPKLDDFATLGKALGKTAEWLAFGKEGGLTAQDINQDLLAQASAAVHGVAAKLGDVTEETQARLVIYIYLEALAGQEITQEKVERLIRVFV